MSQTGADMHTITLEKGLATFLASLSGKNRSAATIRAYQTDISQFISFLHANNVSIQTPADVEKVDVVEYLSSLAKRELTGIARARKMSALREYFRFLEGIGVITKSPTTGIETPKREKNGRQILRSDEYTKMGIVSGSPMGGLHFAQPTRCHPTTLNACYHIVLRWLSTYEMP
jgi:site-specific recombinase XerD